ncbi:MAG: class I SAM-dependent methyltransferase [Chloroflexi bacterium]|nr:class I SAM-dependent methyltransferase [Chloroflexota bacterium]
MKNRQIQIRLWLKKLTRIGVCAPPSKAVKVHDVSAFYYQFNLDSLQVITTAPVSMSRAERLLLYTLVFTLRPTYCLEIGTLYGGSALIMAAAMESLQNNGRIFCVDPEPQINPEHWRRLEPRTTLLKGRSPEILPTARAVAGAPFDFALIDGDHDYYNCFYDAEALLPLVSDGAYLLFHDCFNPLVNRAIDDFGRKYAGQILDIGPMTREITSELLPTGESVPWGGMRLVQVRR